MITEFTCGAFDTSFDPAQVRWAVFINKTQFAYIGLGGETIKLSATPYLTQDMLIEIAVLMNNIKRQYKQLQTNSQDGSLGNG